MKLPGYSFTKQQLVVKLEAEITKYEQDLEVLKKEAAQATWRFEVALKTYERLLEQRGKQ
ncbi:hypothetical protein UFOVP253_62 [uncultured Caudovirales phage]|uniref:Uncharacterized protein n=1 Tax=uncultured Caudovirales phage TaxID=2100421 RepID=A0A6J5LF91_9CAUD|nr:hypothetical protein UFOVP253_62 [uncultured Caudovirales phage]